MKGKADENLTGNRESNLHSLGVSNQEIYPMTDTALQISLPSNF